MRPFPSQPASTMDSESDTQQRRMQNARRRDAGALYLCLSLSVILEHGVHNEHGRA